jgi:hypothetical protein
MSCDAAPCTCPSRQQQPALINQHCNALQFNPQQQGWLVACGVPQQYAGQLIVDAELRAAI